MPKTRAPLTSLAALALGALALGGIAGCGDSSTDPTREYLGAWHYDTASGKVSCIGHDPVGATPEGNKTFGIGLSATEPLVDLSVSPLDTFANCNYVYSIAGATATATPGQMCTLTGKTVVTVTSWTFALTSPTSAEELAAAKVTFTAPDNLGNPTPMSCDFSLMARLTRVSKD